MFLLWGFRENGWVLGLKVDGWWGVTCHVLQAMDRESHRLGCSQPKVYALKCSLWTKAFQKSRASIGELHIYLYSTCPVQSSPILLYPSNLPTHLFQIKDRMMSYFLGYLLIPHKPHCVHIRCHPVCVDLPPWFQQPSNQLSSLKRYRQSPSARMTHQQYLQATHKQQWMATVCRHDISTSTCTHIYT